MTACTHLNEEFVNKGGSPKQGSVVDVDFVVVKGQEGVSAARVGQSETHQPKTDHPCRMSRNYISKQYWFL